MLVSSVVASEEGIMFKRPAYYIYRQCEEVRWNGIDMYVPTEDAYCGYYYMPSLPYGKTLDFIELRGQALEDGFRVKEEAKGLTFSNSGQIYVPVP